MPSKLTKAAYQQLIDENIRWLENLSPDCLERRHIMEVLKASPGHEYPDTDLILDLKNQCIYHESEKRRAMALATKLADALQDMYNDCGNVREIADIYRTVERDVTECTRTAL